MRVLGRDRFDAAVAAVERPVDRGRIRIAFGDGDPSDLRSGLALHATGDGGYGFGLEPDFRLPASSPMATSIALQHLVEAKAGEDWPEVVAAIRYLVERWDPDLPGWEPVPPEIIDHPRAPWWQYATLQGFPANPGVEIVGYLCHFEELVPGSLLADATSVVATALEEITPDIECHEFLCWKRFVRMAPAGIARRSIERLRPAVDQIVETDPDAWDRYVPGPLWVAPVPTSPFHDLVADHIDAHLDHLIDSQGDDGAWAPAWTWGDADDPAWIEAAADWRSPLTVKALMTLHAYDRIESN